jgi:hypothetical protein
MSDIPIQLIVVWLSITEKKENLPTEVFPGKLSILKTSDQKKKLWPEKCSSKAENQDHSLLNLLTAGSAFRFAEESWVRALSR